VLEGHAAPRDQHVEEHLAPLARRLAELTRDQRLSLGEAAARLRFPAIGARPAGAAFGTVKAGVTFCYCALFQCAPIRWEVSPCA
jgi:hypothetical protein